MDGQGRDAHMEPLELCPSTYQNERKMKSVGRMEGMCDTNWSHIKIYNVYSKRTKRTFFLERKNNDVDITTKKIWIHKKSAV